VWCKDCQHQVSLTRPRWPLGKSPKRPCFDWRERLACSRCGRWQVDMVVSGTERRWPATIFAELIRGLLTSTAIAAPAVTVD